MKITKAVITAAGRDQLKLPLQRLVDADGAPKSALQILVEEAAAAGVADIAVIIAPGDEPVFRAAVTTPVRFIEQPEPLGYGHALWCARPFTGNDPFLHLVSDHLHVSHTGVRCAAQLVAVATAQSAAVSAVQATRESKLPYFGAIGGRRVPGSRDLYEIEDVAEKPTPTEAEQRLVVPGLRAGHYLCFFGMHVLTPLIMEILYDAVRAGTKPVQLSPALAQLAGREKYLAFEVAGTRYNIGEKYGLLNAQLALALNGHDRDDVLAQLVELLAKQKRA